MHGVAWSRQAAPVVVGRQAWRLSDVADRLDSLTLTAWVSDGASWTEIQRGTLAELLTPQYWLDVLRRRDLLAPGTVLLSGAIPMHPASGAVIRCQHTVERLPEPVA